MRIPILFAFGAVFVGLLSFVGDAGAATTMTWCSNWKASYVDGGFGEDVGNTTSALNWPARYSHYQVKRINADDTETLISEGILDSAGCTPALSVASFTQYKFKQATKLERSNNRLIYVQPNGNEVYQSTWVWLNSYYTTVGLLMNVAYTHTFTPSWNSPETRVAVVASRMLHSYNTLEYPANTTTRVRTDGEDAPNGGCGWTSLQEPQLPDLGNICVNSHFYYLPQDATLDHTEYKFVVGHEFGHRQARATGGPLQANYEDNAPETDEEVPCNCVGISEHPENAICLGSRTDILTSAQEGWANFYGSSLFNYRDDDGSYGNCKMGWWNKAYDTTPPDLPALPILDETPPVDLDCDFAPKWMERYCDDDVVSNGVTLDWHNFFWLLWANGDERYSVNEITDVWTSNSSGTWSSLVTTVNGMFADPDKRAQFTSKGTSTGVNH